MGQKITLTALLITQSAHHNEEEWKIRWNGGGGNITLNKFKKHEM